MKKIRNVLALLLMLTLLSSMFVFTEAEPAVEVPWQADLLKLMNPADVPRTTQIDIKNTHAQGAEVHTHDIACEISVNGVTYGCEFVFEYTGEAIADWTSVQQWLGDIVTTAARTDGGDSETLAKAIDKAMRSARRSARADGEGAKPLWASEELKVKTIRVSTPFFPELSVGKNGEATQRLQQRLIELGFLNGKADGYFGEQTKAAVQALEGYIRELEQDLIDARPVETATPAPTVAATPNPTPKTTHELTLVPKTTPSAAPTEEPTPEAAPMEMVADSAKLEPVTQIDGVADALLQAYIYSDAYKIARRPLDVDDQGSDVSRLQQRLIQQGYSVDLADGVYGTGTARSVRIFQHYNDLPETGVADLETLGRVFSAEAKAPKHPMLALNSGGDHVRALQTRLRELGFTNVGTDGDYGAATQNAVRNLQQYMQDMERAALLADGSIPADADLSGQLTIEVNGIADPLLLESFYSADFPAIPAAMSSGSSGADVVRVQRRLSGLEYLFGALDGQFGGNTAEAIKSFQKQHGLPQTGEADYATLTRLFSGDAKKAMKPYLVKVSIEDQRVYVYGLDDNNEYTVLVRTMKCSTGKDVTPTPKGTFQATTGPGARWHYFKKFKCWAQYAYYIEGDNMFHSVLYNEKDGPVTQSSVNNLGRKASHGCVRLSVEDAKWLYVNCPKATKIVVY